jgi:hypothetical protein
LSTLQFQFGVITATPAALLALSVSGDEATVFIRRHLTGDWGDLDRHDKRLNEVALTNGGRLFSAYHLADGTKIYIITEADRSATTILLPEDY